MWTCGSVTYQYTLTSELNMTVYMRESLGFLLVLIEMRHSAFFS